MHLVNPLIVGIWEVGTRAMNPRIEIRSCDVDPPPPQGGGLEIGVNPER